MSITHPDDVQKNMDNMALMNAGKISGLNMDKCYRRPDGSYVWINMTNIGILQKHLKRKVFSGIHLDFFRYRFLGNFVYRVPVHINEPVDLMQISGSWAQYDVLQGYEIPYILEYIFQKSTKSTAS